MNLSVKLLAIVGLVFACMGETNAQYKTPASFSSPSKTVTIGQGSYAADSDDDSRVFQKAIDDVNAAGGGHVKVLAGDYNLIDIALKSDVHLVLESGVTIRPPAGGTGNVFNFGDRQHVDNVSFVGPEDRVMFDFSEVDLNTRLRVVGVSDCTNFRIANFDVNDNRTMFSSVILGWNGVRDEKAICGRDGLIENLTANNAHYGYGCLQAHSGENIVFRNIKSVGGVAVRLETGLIPMNKAGVGGLFNILVEGATSVNGQGALMMQPHTMNHGKVVGRNIVADGSEFAFYVSKPFVSKKRYEEGELTPGSFESITVDGVKATYRDGPIVTRFVHLKYYPEELHSQIAYADNWPEPDMRGPSIAAVAVMQDDLESVKISNIEAIGFKYHPDVMTEKDVFKGKVKPSGVKPEKRAAEPKPAKTGKGKGKGKGKKGGKKRREREAAAQ